MRDTGIIATQKIVSHPLSRLMKTGSPCTEDHNDLIEDMGPLCPNCWVLKLNFVTLPPLAAFVTRMRPSAWASVQADGNGFGGRCLCVGSVMVERDQDVGFGVVGGRATAGCRVGDDAVPRCSSFGSREEADDVDAIAIVVSEFGDVVGVDHDDVSITRDPAVTVVVAVDGGVVLIVGSKGLEHQLCFWRIGEWRDIHGGHGEVGLTVLGREASGIAWWVWKHEPAGDPDADVEVGEAGDDCGDVISNEVVVAAKASPGNWVVVAEQLHGEVTDDRHFAAQLR